MCLFCNNKLEKEIEKLKGYVDTLATAIVESGNVVKDIERHFTDIEQKLAELKPKKKSCPHSDTERSI